MQYHFLHLSDLHFRRDWPEQIGLVYRRFLSDLAEQVKNFPDAYLIFSGDVVQAGGEEGTYAIFEAQFDEALKAIGFPIDHRIFVPGNHDISRTSLRPKVTVQHGALSAMVGEETFNANLPLLTQQFFGPTFENYIAFEKRISLYGCCSENLGGGGWDLPNGIGVYCLNTALCSFGGLEDAHGKKIVDQGRLLIDTRSLHRWLGESQHTSRILVMHHPLEWLAEWARDELEKVIANNFRVVVSGHVHNASAVYSSRGGGGSVHCVSPALFTRKVEKLGYSFITLDEKDVNVSYRQWVPSGQFVTGTYFSENDVGIKRFPLVVTIARAVAARLTSSAPNTLEVLQEEFDEAITSYSSKKKIWVERDLGSSPETANGKLSGITTGSSALALNLRCCVIRAPKQFGLTCLGRFLALENSKANPRGGAIVMIDVSAVSPNKHTVKRDLERRCVELGIGIAKVTGIILDNWQNDKRYGIVLNELRLVLPDIPVVVLCSVDDVAEIADPAEVDALINFERFYLWSMTRNRVRELVKAYVVDIATLDENAMMTKVIDEIDSLNLHRTPLNYFTILKLLEQASDDTPVNRTELIRRVLHLLFFEFQEIPRYTTRPDLQDCEHALGYLCEWLVRSQRNSFTKDEFRERVTDYCQKQIVDLDWEILFAFLIAENIFIRKGMDFAFRFLYWMHYFAAQRMYHSKEFAAFILADRRYAAFPEMIEFYAGIDRTREDAVTRLTTDLQEMSAAFLGRTKIADDFEPWKHAQWVPSVPTVEGLLKEVTDSAADSALPIALKDAIADQVYDRSKPYNQELAKFLADPSLRQMMSAVNGAARTLRNSDYVSPEMKLALMEEVVRCWRRVCQILAVLSPLLAEQRRVYFEGLNFVLDESFDEKNDQLRFQGVLSAIPYNVALWFQEDIFSRKMGAMFSRYVAAHHGTLDEALILFVMAMQRPPGWEKELDAFIERSKKNSYYLSEVFSRLLAEFKTSITTERNRQHLRRLTAKALAKHRGSKHPNSKLIERTAKDIDASIEEQARKPRYRRDELADGDVPEGNKEADPSGMDNS